MVSRSRPVTIRTSTLSFAPPRVAPPVTDARVAVRERLCLCMVAGGAMDRGIKGRLRMREGEGWLSTPIAAGRRERWRKGEGKTNVMAFACVLFLFV